MIVSSIVAIISVMTIIATVLASTVMAIMLAVMPSMSLSHTLHKKQGSEENQDCILHRCLRWRKPPPLAGEEPAPFSFKSLILHDTIQTL